MIDPIVKDYLLYNSPIRSQAGKVILSVIVLVVVLLAYFGIYRQDNPFHFWRWVPFAVVGSLVGYFVLSFLDRERRVRFFQLLTIASVLFLTAPAAAFFNDRSPFPLVTVGFVEEGMKILPVLLLAIYVPNLIRTRKDGIVYGALAGLGFNLVEMGLYISQLLKDQSIVDTLVQQSTRLGLWGLSAHVIWSAFVGLGVGLSAESTQHGWRKWKWAIILYLIAALMHSGNDLGLIAVGIIVIAGIESALRGVPLDASNAGRDIGPIWDGMRYGTYLYNIVLIIILIVQIRKSFALENSLQVAELSTEDSSVITEDELNTVKSEGLFSKRTYRNVPKEIGAKLVLYQNLLAMEKHTAKQQNVPVNSIEPVAELRGSIQALRAKVA